MKCTMTFLIRYDVNVCERASACVCLCSDACTRDGNVSALWRQPQLILSTYSPSVGPIVLTSLKNTLSHLVQTHQIKCASRKKEMRKAIFSVKYHSTDTNTDHFRLRDRSTCIEAPNFVIYGRHHAAASPKGKKSKRDLEIRHQQQLSKGKEQIQSCSRLIIRCERVSKCMMRK